MAPEFGYPGGKEEGKKPLTRFVDLGTDEHNFYWHFAMCEEWRDLEPADLYPLDQLTDPQSRERMQREAEYKLEFARWRFKLSAFCDRIFDLIAAQASVITDHDLPRDPVSHNR